MKNQAQVETARKIDALRTEGYRLAGVRSSRVSLSLIVMAFGVVVFIVGLFFNSPPVIFIGLFSTLGGSLISMDGIRIRFKMENIDIKMRTLDPEARLMTSHAEEFGRALRAGIDKRAAEKNLR